MKKLGQRLRRDELHRGDIFTHGIDAGERPFIVVSNNGACRNPEYSKTTINIYVS